MIECAQCGEMKQEIDYQAYPNGARNRWCRTCMASGVRGGRARSGRNQAVWLNWERKQRRAKEEGRRHEQS